MKTVKEIRKITGLSQVAFGKYYGIPRRTVENWENKSAPPDYIINLLRRAVLDDFQHKKEG